MWITYKDKISIFFSSLSLLFAFKPGHPIANCVERFLRTSYRHSEFMHWTWALRSSRCVYVIFIYLFTWLPRLLRTYSISGVLPPRFMFGGEWAFMYVWWSCMGDDDETQQIINFHFAREFKRWAEMKIEEVTAMFTLSLNFHQTPSDSRRRVIKQKKIVWSSQRPNLPRRHRRIPAHTIIAHYIVPILTRISNRDN